jgi:predicted Zn-ribbon and HTH transcriptional regulator
MCSGGGPMNLAMEELKWFKYRCKSCGKVYKSTGKKAVCPECKSEDVEDVTKV